MDKAITKTTQNQVFDIVIASQIDMAQYILNIPRSRANYRILEEIELTTLFEQHTQASNSIQRLRGQLMWKKWIRYINHIMQQIDGFTSVSEPELSRVTSIINQNSNVPRKRVAPNGIDVNFYQGEFGSPIPNTLIYSGALSYKANFDAVDYFLREIWPFVLAKRPEVKLSITGKTDPVLVERLSNLVNVEFTGYLKDIRPAIAQSWINIVPLRIGGGTRLKILESLALKTPVISTTKGAEGLALTPNKDILISDQPEIFAQQILRLLGDFNLRTKLGKQGHQAVLEYSWDNIGYEINKFIEQVSGK
jgi:glycosyltransferase involved in cell wall biosynthesis